MRSDPQPRPDGLTPGDHTLEQESSGRLKIFFGYAAGVGKTYAMLDAALRAKEAGTDVVLGFLAPAAYPDTLALAGGLERLPPLIPPGGGQGEFDLDGALRRRPQLILVDELAHSNNKGARHAKRYQDIAELLRAGIDVYSTMDVQQLESLSDVVSSITGFSAPERVPDQVFDSADQVEIVDLEPSDLLARLRAGTIGGGEGHLLTEQTLAALRELSLRRTADRLERKPSGGDRYPPRAREHILICLSGSPSNEKVIRTAARMAEAFHGAFTALFVETPSFQGQSDKERRQLRNNLHLAEELGARISTVYGDDPAIQIAEYAKVSGISKIVLGRSPQKRGPLLGAKSLMDRLGELAPDLDIYIIPDQVQRPARHSWQPYLLQERFSVRDLFKALLILAACTAVGFLFQRAGFSTENVIMVYILGVLTISMATTGHSYSLLASLCSVFIFNYFFTYPYFTLMSDPSYIATFAVMLTVALLGSSLTTRVKRQAIQSAQKAYRTEILLETSQKLQKAEGSREILAVTATQLKKLLERDVLIYSADEDGLEQEAMLFPVSKGGDMSAYLTSSERAVAEWVWNNNKHAGATTHTLPSSKCLYIAVRGSDKVLAVVGIAIPNAQKVDSFEKNLTVAILDECGLALEKELTARAKQQIEELAHQETLRANLLRAISHDLRTPLTSISGNAGILMENGAVLDEEKRRYLYRSIYDDSMWLINLVENLLSLTRMGNGSVSLNIRPELLDEVFHEALSHLDRNAEQHHISVELEDDLLMADMDARLIVQVVINLVNNAIKYTPAGSHISLSAVRAGPFVQVEVSDDGPGIADSAKQKIFDMFYTADNSRGDGQRGLGLGLSLCRSIITAHGGEISVQDHQPHGSVFRFTLRASEVKMYE